MRVTFDTTHNSLFVQYILDACHLTSSCTVSEGTELQLNGKPTNPVALLLAVFEHCQSSLLPSDPLQKLEVKGWLNFCFFFSREVAQVLPEQLPQLELALATRSFLVADRLSLADLAVFVSLVCNSSSLEESGCLCKFRDFLAVRRWFDCLQHASIGRRVLHQFAQQEASVGRVPSSIQDGSDANTLLGLPPMPLTSALIFHSSSSSSSSSTSSSSSSSSSSEEEKKESPQTEKVKNKEIF
jgi:hypothetical protein